MKTRERKKYNNIARKCICNVNTPQSNLNFDLKTRFGLYLIIPDDDDLRKTWNFGDARDDTEQRVQPIVGQNHGRET